MWNERYNRAEYVFGTEPNDFLKENFQKITEENIKKLCQTVITEYLHNPSKQLKDISKNMECDIVIGTVQNMFGLNRDSISSSKYKCEHLTKN